MKQKSLAFIRANFIKKASARAINMPPWLSAPSPARGTYVGALSSQSLAKKVSMRPDVVRITCLQSYIMNLFQPAKSMGC